MADIRIGVDANTSGVAGAIKKGILEPLKDVDKALDGVEGSSEKMGDTIVRESKKASRAIKNIGDEGFSKAGDSTKAFKDEAVQNFSEVASSFNGDITQMADGVQGLTGGLASALTPGVGIPLALLGAAAGAFIASWTQAAEDSKERIDSFYQDMVDSGKTALSESFIDQAVTDLAGDGAKWDEATRRAEESGHAIGEVLRAMVGDGEAINSILDTQRQKHEANIQAIDDSTDSTEWKLAAVENENLKYEAQVGWLKQVAADTDTAGKKAAIVRDTINQIPGEKPVNVKVTADMTDLERQIAAIESRTVYLKVRGEGMSDGRFVP